jgi:hypothetical protein
MKRQPDGRFRGNRSSIQVTNKILISRWVERETIRLKRMGVASFETIADLLTRAGRGEYVPTVSLPEGVSFPPDYRISKMGVCKAYRRRMEREPSFEAQEHRRLDTDRCEEMFLSLQPGIKKGDPKAIEAGVRVLTLKAKVIGYETRGKLELIGNRDAPIPITLVREVIERVEQEDTKEEDKKNNEHNDG